MSKKALIYCRESLDNTEQIKAQRKICEDFCAENDIGYYSDPKIDKYIDKTWTIR